MVGASSGIGRATAALLCAGPTWCCRPATAQACRLSVDEHHGSVAWPLDGPTAQVSRDRCAAVLAGGPLTWWCYCAGHYRDMRATDFDLAEAPAPPKT